MKEILSYMMRTSFYTTVFILFAYLIFHFAGSLISARSRARLWTILLLRMLFLVPAFSIPWYTYTEYNAVSGTLPETLMGTAPSVAEKNSSSSKNLQFNPEFLLFCIWIVVAFGLLILRIITYFDYKKKLYLQNIPAHPLDVQKKAAVCESLNIDSKRIYIYKNEKVISPFVIGLRNPCILIGSVSEPELEFILRHELIHIKHKDLWVQALLTILHCFQWFNPFYYLLRNQLQKELEFACDEEVISTLDETERYSYGKLLFKTASVNVSLGNLGLSRKGINLKKRLELIRKPPKSKPHSVLVVLVMLFVLWNAFFAFRVSSSGVPEELRDFLSACTFQKLRIYNSGNENQAYGSSGITAKTLDNSFAEHIQTILLKSEYQETEYAKKNLAAGIVAVNKEGNGVALYPDYNGNTYVIPFYKSTSFEFSSYLAPKDLYDEIYLTLEAHSLQENTPPIPYGKPPQIQFSHTRLMESNDFCTIISISQDTLQRAAKCTISVHKGSLLLGKRKGKDFTISDFSTQITYQAPVLNDHDQISILFYDDADNYIGSYTCSVESKDFSSHSSGYEISIFSYLLNEA